MSSKEFVEWGSITGPVREAEACDESLTLTDVQYYWSTLSQMTLSDNTARSPSAQHIPYAKIGYPCRVRANCHSSSFSKVTVKHVVSSTCQFVAQTAGDVSDFEQGTQLESLSATRFRSFRTLFRNNVYFVPGVSWCR